MKYNKKDHYHQKAKDDGYLARSAYKLKEIIKRYPQAWKKDGVILDLGCAPGAWTQVVLQNLTANGTVVGVDIAEMESIQDRRFEFYQDDIYEWEPKDDQMFDVVLSDMAPKTTGVKVTDHLRSISLCERAVEIADEHLNIGGSLVFKVFEGGDLNKLVNSLRVKYTKIERYRPDSTRQASKEIYIIGIKKTPL